MLEYKSFRVKNGKTFRDVEFPLKDLGVVAIQGKNGTGKSSVWDLLQVMHYGKTSGDPGHRKDELVRNKKDCHWELEFNKDGHEYLIEYSRKKHGSDKSQKWKFTIYEDGKDITTHNQQDVPKQLDEIIGLSQKEFEGSVHLTQNGQHILIKGKPSARKDYISEFFNLDGRYDEVLEHAKKKLKETKEEISRISALALAKSTLEDELKDITVPDIASLSKSVQKLLEDMNAYKVRIGSLNLELESIKNYNKYSPIAHKIANPHEVKAQIELESAQLSAQIEQQNMVAAYNSQAIANNNLINSLKTELENLSITLEGSYADLTARLHELKNIKTNDSQFKAMRAELSTIPETVFTDLTEANGHISNLAISVGMLKQKLSAVQNGECPTCGHSYESNELEDLKLNIKNQEELLDQWKKYKEQSEANNKLFERRGQLETLLINATEFTNDMEIQLNQLIVELPSIKRREEITRDLSNRVIQEVHPTVDTSTLKEQWLKKQQELVQVKEVLDALERCPSKPTRSLQQVIDELEQESEGYTKVESILAESQKELAIAEEKKYRYDRLVNQISKLNSELSQLEQLARDEFLFSKLVEAYGPKGVRLIQLNKVMDLLMERLPYFTRLLFPAKNQRFYHICDAGNISIMWERTDEEGTYSVDVAQLSGAESKKLAVALVLALASCVPSHKRANILVLDEIDGQLDDDGKYALANELLPVLKKDYKSIFIISHSPDVKQADVYDEVWYFEKPERSHYTIFNRQKI